ncbi:MAG: phosphoribosylanthranilate isomerase [Alphaproteobacteria bacterium]|nr:phosphoribosylanthranilate isomerase [Alphaproteobacteria bacterium]
MLVKVCGVRGPVDVEACLAAGVDRVGLNFAPGSRRRLEPAQARSLAGLLPEGSGVAVFADPTLAFVREVLEHTGLRIAQIHGTCPFLRDLEGVDVIRALPGDARDLATFESPHVAAFLLDGPRPGSGTPWAWEGVGAELAGRPVWLAGGLTPENVQQAIAHVQPAGVDVASGVERDGTIDPQRVGAFVRAARQEGTR